MVVSCDTYKSTDLNSGSAGGYIGYGSAVRVSNSSVTKLKHTTVKHLMQILMIQTVLSYFGEYFKLCPFQQPKMLEAM